LKEIHFNLKDYIFLRSNKLLENIQNLKDIDFVNSKQIYFITKIKKIRFKKKSLSIGLNYNFKGSIYIGNDEYNFNISLLDYFNFLWSQKNKEYILPQKIIQKIYECKFKIKVINTLCSKYKFYKDFKIENINNKTIIFTSNLLSVLTKGETNELPIYSENFIGYLIDKKYIQINNFYNKLIYIGKSKNIISRTSNHNQCLQFYNQLEDDQELLFYLIDFTIHQRIFNPNMLVQEKKLSKLDIDFIEARLINYFKPVTNTIYKDTSHILKTKKFKSYYHNNQFDYIYIGIETDNIMSKFGNEHIQAKNIHLVCDKI